MTMKDSVVSCSGGLCPGEGGGGLEKGITTFQRYVILFIYFIYFFMWVVPWVGIEHRPQH